MDLSLLPFTVHVPHLTNRVALAAHLGVRLHPDWPNPNFAQVLTIFQAWFAENPELATWVWFVVVDGEVVGEAGVKALPDDDGCVEIGYGLVPTARGKGTATEAVRLLINLAQARGVRKVIAEVLDDNPASQRVLTKLGFARVRSAESDEGPSGWWELDLGEPPTRPETRSPPGRTRRSARGSRRA